MGADDSSRAIQFQKAVPSLPVESCAEAIRYYRDVLGFALDFDDAVLGRSEVMFAGVSRGECALTLNQHDQTGAKLIVGCEVGDVDALYEELLSRGVRILIAPQDEPWGERHMAITDLYGHELHFSAPVPPG